MPPPFGVPFARKQGNHRAAQSARLGTAGLPPAETQGGKDGAALRSAPSLGGMAWLVVGMAIVGPAVMAMAGAVPAAAWPSPLRDARARVEEALPAELTKPRAALLLVVASAAYVALQWSVAPQPAPKRAASSAKPTAPPAPSARPLSPLRPGDSPAAAKQASASATTPTPQPPQPHHPPASPPHAATIPGMWAGAPANTPWLSFSRALATAVGTPTTRDERPVPSPPVSPAPPLHDLAAKVYQPSSRRAPLHATLTDAMAAGGSPAAVIAALNELGCPPPGGDTEPWIDNLREWYAGTLLPTFLAKVDAAAERITSDALYAELRASTTEPQLPATLPTPGADATPSAWPLGNTAAQANGAAVKSEWEVDNMLRQLHNACAGKISQLAATPAPPAGGGLFGGGGGGLFGGGGGGGGLFGGGGGGLFGGTTSAPVQNRLQGDVEAWRRLASACHDYRCVSAILGGGCAASGDGPADEGLTGSLSPQWTLRRVRALAEGTCMAAYAWSDDGTLVLHLFAAWLRHPGFSFHLSRTTGQPDPSANESGAVGRGGPLYLDAKKVPTRAPPVRFLALVPRRPACQLPPGARVVVCPPRRDSGLPSYSVLFGEPDSSSTVVSGSAPFAGARSSADSLGTVACHGHAGAFHAVLLLLAASRAEGDGLLGGLRVDGSALRLGGVLARPPWRPWSLASYT